MLVYQRVIIAPIVLVVGGLPTPLKNMSSYEFVSWDDYSQYMEK